MKQNIIHLITAYLNSQKNYLDSKAKIIIEDNYTCIICKYQGMDIEVNIYNDTFIKLKVDKLPFAICDGIKSFREEFNRLSLLKYDW